ncbi:hypothetical protein [Streptomyces sp. NPDC058657]|uniref:hypothetical protein n=1 Tax=unclassified Streptomyces TaxID=2593676 RepID=UPI003646E96F
MYSLALDDMSLGLTDRPIDDEDFVQLPFGLTLGAVVAVRAHEVRAGDLVVAEFPAEFGVRTVEHVPDPYVAAPVSTRECPCERCEECDALNAWIADDHRRIADLALRYVCLAPSEGDEPCALTLRHRPVAVIPAATVASAKAADERTPVLTTYSVVWRAGFEAASPKEAALLAYEQLKTYGTDAWPPELEVTGASGDTVTFDLYTEGAGQ